MKKKETLKKFTSVDDLKKELDNKKWHWWEYIEIYWHRYFWNWARNLKWRIPTWWQRSFHGWGYADTWGLDGYLSKVIYESLTYLKKHKHGTPVLLNKQSNEWNKKDYLTNEKQWDIILDKMIKTFRLARDIGNTIYYFPSKNWNKKTYQTYVKMCKDFNKKWPEDNHRTMTLKESKEYEEGFDLFKEHFFSLWD